MNRHIHACAQFCSQLRKQLELRPDDMHEDSLKSPVSALLEKFAAIFELSNAHTTPEKHLSRERVRPDMAVHIGGLICGYVELKSPGKGADASGMSGRNQEQYARLSNLPNVLYTDGREWALYRFGKRTGALVRFREDSNLVNCPVVHEDSVCRLRDLLRDFLHWNPVVPHDPKRLAKYLAPLACILRDETARGLERKGSKVSRVKNDLNVLLIPDMDNTEFAHTVAQTVTYSLLLARLEGVGDLSSGQTARRLQDRNPMLALSLRIFESAEEELKIGFSMLRRALEALDAGKFLQSKPDMDIYFYEYFLEAYDPKLRKNAGVYYTPKQVVALQTRLAEQLLIERFDKMDGFASDGVVLLDPAVGTGAYLIEALHHGMRRIGKRYGSGAVAARAMVMANNMHGIEILVGPYAVARLQLTKAIREYRQQTEPEDPSLNIYLADTLASPYKNLPGFLPLEYEEWTREQEAARKIKTEGDILVCVGNPPYDRQSIEQGDKHTRRKGGWVRFGDDSEGGTRSERQGERPLLDDFLQPARRTRAERHLKNLYNDYVYFWRWALWRLFQQQSCGGIISFITASSYLRGPGFVGMREIMRKTFDELWILDLQGSGRGARKNANVFNIQTPVAIAIGIRGPRANPKIPAKVRYLKLPGTIREEKFQMLDLIESLNLKEVSPLEWRDCPQDWQDPFVPASTGLFSSWPTLPELFPWQNPGCQFKRTWPIGETKEVLEERWRSLVSASREHKVRLFKENSGKKIDYRRDADIPGGGELSIQELKSDAPLPLILPYSYRSLDNQLALVDVRLCDRLRPNLLRVVSDKAIFLTSALHETLGKGAAMSVAPYLPDIHLPSGGGKDIIPLFNDKEGKEANISHGLLSLLTKQYARSVSAEDFAAYVYALLGGQSYTERFWDELENDVPRIPITKNYALFEEAFEQGYRLIWLHTYAQRFQNEYQGRGKEIPVGRAKCIQGIPESEHSYPEKFRYDSAKAEIRLVCRGGFGIVGPVGQEVWEYEVSGLKVVQSWLGYRMKNPKGRKSSPLDQVRPRQWPAKMTEEFLRLLWIIEETLKMEPNLSNTLARIVDRDCYKANDLPRPTSELISPSEKARRSLDMLDMDKYKD